MSKQLEDLGGKIGLAQIRRPYIFLMSLIILLLVIGPGILFLPQNIEPSIEKLMPSQTAEVKLMNEMRAEFGADMIYVVLSIKGPVQDIRNPDSLEYISALSERISLNEHILQTRSLADSIKQINNNRIPQEKYIIDEQIRYQIPQEDIDMFTNKDFSVTYIEITTDTGAHAKTIAQVIESINNDIYLFEDLNPGFKVQLTGFSTIDKATFDVIISDFKNITGISFIAMLIFLYFYFGRNIRKTFSSVVIIMISLILTAGITGYLNLTITVMTMVAAAMIMALGISYGIHFTHTYANLRKNNNKKQSIIILQQELIRALLGSSLTTSAGFLALLFGVLPAMKILGIVLAIGIVITLLVGILFLPVIMLLLDTPSKGNARKIIKKI